MSRLRARRVEEAIREEVAALVQRELRDPRIGFVSVTRVEVSDDLRHARIHVSVLGGEGDLERTLAGLESARGLVKAQVARRLGLRAAPEIVFAADRSLAHAERVTRLIRLTGGSGDGRAGDRRRAVEALKAARRIVIMLHQRPDGDSIGSSLALGLGLRQLGKDVVLVRSDDLPDNMRFLRGSQEFRLHGEVEGPFDAAVFLDCGDVSRVGEARRLLEGVAVIVNVDHHLSNTRFGHVNWIEPEAAATGELVYRLLLDLGVRVDADMAAAIYASVVTDTGSFNYENTRAGTHRLAARLIELGVDPAEAGRQIWEERPPSSLRLLAEGLATLSVDPDGRLAWVELSLAAFRRAGAERWESEGIVNYPRQIKGVEVAALFIEEREPVPSSPGAAREGGASADGDVPARGAAAGTGEPGEVKVSLRSNRWVDVSRIAAAFGGGGHARAAGCTVAGSLPEVRERVLAACRQALAAGHEGS